MEMVTMKVLQERYLELLEELGIENKEYRTEKLKTRMVKQFGSLLHFGTQVIARSPKLFTVMLYQKEN